MKPEALYKTTLVVWSTFDPDVKGTEELLEAAIREKTAFTSYGRTVLLVGAELYADANYRDTIGDGWWEPIGPTEMPKGGA